LAFVALVIVHVYSVSLCIPPLIHHTPFCQHNSTRRFTIEADGISHSPGRRRPSHSAGSGRISGDWNHSSQSGRDNRGATQPRNTSAASLTQQRPSGSPPTTRKLSRDTVVWPKHAAKQSTKGHCPLVPPFHSFRPDWSTPQSNTSDRQTGAVRHSNPPVVLPHSAPPPVSRRTTSCRP